MPFWSEQPVNQAQHPKGDAEAQQEWPALPCRQSALPVPSARPRQEPREKPPGATRDCEEPQDTPREQPKATPREQSQTTPRDEPQAAPREEPRQKYQLVSHGSGRWIVSIMTTLKVFLRET